MGILASSPKSTELLNMEFFPENLEQLPSPIPHHTLRKKAKWTNSSRSLWIPELNLRNSDKEILQNPTGWLNDLLIDSAQTLLRELSCVPGLQSVSLGWNRMFNIQHGEFIQILNTGAGHWVTVSSVGSHPVINIYDSKYSSTTSDLQEQIASIVCSPYSTLVLQFPNVSLQSGSSDCGLYAIAYATCLALGEDPTNYHFDQRCMRDHLVQCLESKKMKTFPILRERRRKMKNTIKAVENISIYCMCRMPESGKMISCTECGQWCHTACCNSVPSKALQTSSYPWLCPNCC